MTGFEEKGRQPERRQAWRTGSVRTAGPFLCWPENGPKTIYHLVKRASFEARKAGRILGPGLRLACTGIRDSDGAPCRAASALSHRCQQRATRASGKEGAQAARLERGAMIRVCSSGVA